MFLKFKKGKNEDEYWEWLETDSIFCTSLRVDFYIADLTMEGALSSVWVLSLQVCYSLFWGLEKNSKEGIPHVFIVAILL